MDTSKPISESSYQSQKMTSKNPSPKSESTTEGRVKGGDSTKSSPKDQEIFRKLHFMRKEGLEEMDEGIGGLVKRCRFWKLQLDSLQEQNRQLKREERSLRKEYDELLRKTRNNNEVLLNLQDCEKQVRYDSGDLCAAERKLRTSRFTNLDLSSYRMLLESDKKELVQNVKANSDRLVRINRTYARLQEGVLQQKKWREDNQKRYDAVLRAHEDSLVRDADLVEEVKRAFAERESMTESFSQLVGNGLKAYLKLNIQDSREVEDAQTPLPMKLSEPEDQGASVEKNPAESEERRTSNAHPDPAERELDPRLTRSRTLFDSSLKRHSQLQEIYSFLNNRMKHLNDLYVKNNELCNQKGVELQRMADEASDLFRLILQKRKKFLVPKRKPIDELEIKILNQEEKNKVLKTLVSLFLSFNSEDSRMYRGFSNELQDIYRSSMVGTTGKPNQDVAEK